MSEFFGEPNREKLREILRSYDSEYDNLDFKKDWIDNAKLSKHVLAMGNSGGGLIVFGVIENDDKTFSVEGLEELKDKADVAIDQYLPEDARDIYVIENFDYASSDWGELEGKKFQVLLIDDVPMILPLIAQKGAEGRIKRDAIYVRKNTRSVEAGQSDLNRLIDHRVRAQLNQESGDLRKDLSQLRALYDFASKDKPTPLGVPDSSSVHFSLEEQLLPGRRGDFHRFIERKISEKEKQIEERLGLR
jgi:hypothetical protein